VKVGKNQCFSFV